MVSRYSIQKARSLLKKRVYRRTALAVLVLVTHIGLSPGTVFGQQQEPEFPAGAIAPEPSSYKDDNYRSPTPATLRGARVVSTAEVYALWMSKAVIFVDTMPRAPKPQNLPRNTIWRDAPRSNIPGSTWLVDVGYGAISSEREAYFRTHLQQLTGGDKTRPVLFYCKRACWMSWNAAKRAMEEYGYSKVMWFPDGSDGWADAGYEVTEAQPAP